VSVLLLLLALAVVGVVGAVAAGVVTGGLAAPEHDRAGAPLPAGRLGAADVERVRFSTGLRGYRMDEVDAALARLREELAARDAERTTAPVPAPEG
jgi:DivIVA domain-containing protein